MVTFGTSPTVLPQAKGGKLRALAVSVRDGSPLVPDLPGMKEAGLPDHEVNRIVGQYGISTMAAAEVRCIDCHQVSAGYPGAVEHEGTYVLGSPTTVKCERWHSAEVAQFYQSRHSLPAYVAYAGTQDLSPAHLAMYAAIPEGSYAPDKSRNALFAIEGPDITNFACETCHSVGDPAVDGSVGQCSKCHLRHTFRLEQARKPETCNACHIGPDRPRSSMRPGASRCRSTARTSRRRWSSNR